MKKIREFSAGLTVFLTAVVLFSLLLSSCDDKSAYREGYSAGYDDGHADAYSSGYDEGESDGYRDGRVEGYESGYDDGIAFFKESGALSDEYDKGYEDGRRAGIIEGYETGYIAGYYDGFDDAEVAGDDNPDWQESADAAGIIKP